MLKFCARAAVITALVSVGLILVAISAQTGKHDNLLIQSRWDTMGSEWSLMDTRTRTLYRLLKNTFDASWSPDGTRVMYLSRPGSRITPQVLELESGIVQQFSTGMSDIGHMPQWSPDGLSLLTIDYGSPMAPLYMLHLTDGSVEYLNVQTRDYFGWTPDGEGVYFTQQSTTMILNLQTDAITPFVPGVNPRWSPDGQWVAFEQSDKSTNQSTLVLLNTFTRQQHPIIVHAENVLVHEWSPDGHWLVFTAVAKVANGGTVRTLYLLNPVSMAVRDMSSGFNSICEVDWSPDGKLTYLDDRGWFGQLDIERDTFEPLFAAQSPCAVHDWRPQKEM
jgi:Tol biopolymer transport system component